MSTFQKKSFNAPEETRTPTNARVELVKFGDMPVARVSYGPGWKWSEHVKPVVGTDSCQVAHFNYGISGRLHVRMDDGTESEVGPGDVQLLGPGHDAWVVGDKPFVMLDFQGGKIYGK